MHKSSASSLIFAMLLCGVFLSAQAEYHVLIDEKLTHTRGSAWYQDPINPDSWTNPDYLHGAAYIRVEILDKPDNHPASIQICFWLTDNKPDGEFCVSTKIGLNYIAFNSVGDVRWQKIPDLSKLPYPHTPSNQWQGEPLKKLLYQLRIDGKHARNIDSKYLPITWYSKIVCVAKGTTAPLREIWPDCPAEWADGVHAKNGARRSAAASPISIAHCRNGVKKIMLGETQVNKITISAVNGQAVKTLSISGQKSVELYTQHMPAGLYFVNAAGANEVYRNSFLTY